VVSEKRASRLCLKNRFVEDSCREKCVLKNNMGFFWVSAVVLPEAFFFALDRWVLRGLLLVLFLAREGFV
jgi:hypothetical protein